MTLSRPVAVGAGVVALAVAFWVFRPRPKPGPEELVRRKVIQMARAAENRQLGDVLEDVSDSFRTAEGWSRQELKPILAGYILRGDWVRVFLVSDPQTQRISPTEVSVTVKILFGRAKVDRLEDLPVESILNALQLDGRAKQDADGEWRFVWASHKQLDPIELLGR